MRAGIPSAPLIARTLRENFDGGAWHGPSVQTALAAVDAGLARWRPAPRRNCIWDITLHLAYTRFIMVRRLTRAPYQRFPRALAHSWWPALPPRRSDAAWEEDVTLLRAWHALLLEVVAHAPARVLRSTRPGQRRTLADEVLGVATHDAYHAGQIQLLRRLQGGAR